MQDWITGLMNSFGYLGVGLLIFLENIFPPIPSEIILPFGGFMTTQSNLQVPLVVVAATVGSVAGALVLYAVGSILNEERLERWLNGRIGKILRFKPDDVHKARVWFLKKGSISVLLCRCVPIVRSLISIPAGMAKMKLPKFILFTTIGSAVWNTVLVSLGALMGESWDKIADYVGAYSHVVVWLIVLAVVVLLAVWLVRRHLKHKKKAGDAQEDKRD